MNLGIITIVYIIIILLCYILNIKYKKIFNTDVWHENPKIWSNNTNKTGNDADKQLFDVYSFTHITHGILLYIIMYYFITKNNNYIFLSIFVITIVFELIENSDYIIKKLKKNVEHQKLTGDSIVNMITDVYLAFLGAYFCYILCPNFTLPLLYFILSEIILYIKINNNFIMIFTTIFV